jgi:hypothetical protein
MNHIPIYVINPNEKFKNDIWLKYHVQKMFKTIDSCFEHIRLISASE